MLIRAPGVRSLHIQAAERASALELTICGDGADGAYVAAAPGSNRSALELLAIRERAAAVGGTIAINSTAECDTCIVARFPLDATIG